MPCFQIQHNTQIEPSLEQLKLISTTLSKTIGKPETYVSISVSKNNSMFFGGTNEPTAVCELTSIGKLSPDENITHAAALTPVISDIFGISSDRFYIFYKNVERHEVSWTGKCFHDR